MSRLVEGSTHAQYAADSRSGLTSREQLKEEESEMTVVIKDGLLQADDEYDVVQIRRRQGLQHVIRW